MWKYLYTIGKKNLSSIFFEIVLMYNTEKRFPSAIINVD